MKNLLTNSDVTNHYQMYQLLFEHSPTAILMIRENKLQKVNPAGCDLWQVANEEALLNRPFQDLFSEASFDWINGLNTNFSKSCDLHIIRLNGEYVDVHISSIVFNDSIGKATYLMLTNITERKNYEAFRFENERQFRKLSHHIEEARENERTQIAQEIHDELGSTLTILKMDLYWITKKLSNSIPEECQDKAATILKYVDKAIKITRNLITDLRPTILDHLGLVAAIEWQIQKFREQHEIACTLKIPDDNIHVDSKMSIVAFRIIQESLNNIVKHSHATAVNIELQDVSNFIVVKIKDNGIGITKEKVNESERYGIQGMYERVNFCGGAISLFSEPDKGTIVFFKIPKLEIEGE